MRRVARRHFRLAETNTRRDSGIRYEERQPLHGTFIIAGQKLPFLGTVDHLAG
jgi:hypothetical protein